MRYFSRLVKQYSGRNKELNGVHQSEIFRESVRLLYANNNISLIATTINSLLLAFIVRNVVQLSTILTWITMTVTLTLCRYCLSRSFSKNNVPDVRIGFWYRLQIISISLSGISWGIGGIILFPEDQLPYQIFIAFLLGGMVAGSAGIYSLRLMAFLCYSIPTILPITVCFFLIGEEIHTFMGILVVVFWTMMMLTAYRLSIFINISLKRKFENIDLINELAGKNEQLIDEIKAKESAYVEAQKSKVRAESANKAKSEFLANMSHEFRTPLNHIIGFTELITDKHLGELNDQQVEGLNDVLKSGNHLLGLINDILDLSKVEAGRVELNRSDINLKELIETNLKTMRNTAEQKGLELLSNTEGIPERINFDEQKMNQILLNLLSNAVKFSHKNGKIIVSANRVKENDSVSTEILNRKHHRNNGCVELSVSDTGIGIAKENRARIFSAFTQVESITKSKHQGTGLGLTLTKRLVELHGGEIWVESEGEDRGSTFKFTIPIQEA